MQILDGGLASERGWAPQKERRWRGIQDSKLRKNIICQRCGTRSTTECESSCCISGISSPIQIFERLLDSPPRWDPRCEGPGTPQSRSYLLNQFPRCHQKFSPRVSYPQEPSGCPFFVEGAKKREAGLFCKESRGGTTHSSRESTALPSRRGRKEGREGQQDESGASDALIGFWGLSLRDLQNVCVCVCGVPFLL